jgi:hypothetical protein
MVSTSKKKGYPLGTSMEHSTLGDDTVSNETKQKSRSTALLLYVKNVCNCMCRVMEWLNIATIQLPLQKTCSILRNVKKSLSLKAPDVYKIQREYRAIYLSNRLHDKIFTKKHHAHIRLYCPTTI